eukprot:5157792-Lingulodinium_polyedra.AAC.1
MLRSSRPFATATARCSHARALHARASFWRAHGTRACELRTAAVVNGRLDRTIALRLENAAP